MEQTSYRFYGGNREREVSKMLKVFHKIVKKSIIEEYANQTPAIKVSICTGEKAAGFLDQNNHFTELMLIKSEDDLLNFCKTYSVKKEQIKNIW